MATKDLVRSGIAGLDSILAGIPRRDIILLEGVIGTSKTTMGAGFVYRRATESDEPGGTVLCEVSPDRLACDAAPRNPHALSAASCSRFGGRIQ